MTALQPYGVRIYGYSEEPLMVNPLTVLKMEMKLRGDLGLPIPSALPIAQVAKVTVSKAAAAWAEYLLLRTGKLYRLGGYINARNKQWAALHGGRMPPAWHDGKPWIEASCSEGVSAWQRVKDAARQAQTPSSGRRFGRKLTK